MSVTSCVKLLSINCRLCARSWRVAVWFAHRQYYRHAYDAFIILTTQFCSVFCLQRIFYVLTYIRKKSYEMCHRKFRIQFVVFSVLWKPIRCERWWRSFPAPTLACGKVLICGTVRPVKLSCVWVQLSIELCIYGVAIWDHHFVCMYTHWQFLKIHRFLRNLA